MIHVAWKYFTMRYYVTETIPVHKDNYKLYLFKTREFGILLEINIAR